MGQRGLAVPFVVAIGASAGGIKAIAQILNALPKDFPAPILIMQHVARDHPSHLTDVLRYRTTFPISDGHDGDDIESGHAYVATPNKHLLVDATGHLRNEQSGQVHFARPSVDVLFASLAPVYRNRVIAVVLTGGGSDGTTGAHTVRQHGGRVIAQSLASCEHSGMPRSVIEHGDADEEISLESIAPRLVLLTTRN